MKLRISCTKATLTRQRVNRRKGDPVSDRRSVVSGLWSVVCGQWSVVSGLAVSAILALQTGAFAQTALTNHPSSGFVGPRIRFATTTFEFGRVPSGERVVHDFIFTNTGPAPLEITDVRPTCGCTVARASERTVQPGKTGVIPVQLDTSDFVGTIYKTVIVQCNDPLTNSITLALTGTAWKPVEVTPQFAGFVVSSDVETNETRVLRITNNMEEALNFSDPVCTNTAFQCALKTIHPGKEFELDVTFVLNRAVPLLGIRERLDAPLSKPTQIMSPILLKSSSSKFEYLTLTAMATIQPAIVAMPAELRLPVNGLASGAELSIYVRSYAAKPLEVTEPTVNVPGATVQARESLPGRVYILNVNFPNGSKPPPGQSAEIRFKTNHPQYPLMKVPVVEDSPRVNKGTQS